MSLAQTKLELVESQCRNQDLTHQMNTLIAEIQSNRSSWQPWLTKTINTIQEKVASTKRDTPTFQSYMAQPASVTSPTSMVIVPPPSYHSFYLFHNFIHLWWFLFICFLCSHQAVPKVLKMLLTAYFFCFLSIGTGEHKRTSKNTTQSIS